MQIQITRIENSIVTCEILSGDGGVIDIARQWFTDDISIGDQIEVDLEKILDGTAGQLKMKRRRTNA